MRRIVAKAWKPAVSAGILAYLLANMSTEAAGVLGQPKHWGCLAPGFLLCGTAVSLTLVRWGMLARALELDLSTMQALRIGYVAYLCNFLAPLGIVGGDGVKIAMLAWGRPGGLGKAAASVLVDRLIGLYTLFVLASAAIVLSGFPSTQSVLLVSLSQMTLGVTVVGTVAILGVLLDFALRMAPADQREVGKTGLPLGALGSLAMQDPIVLQVPGTPLVSGLSRIPLLGRLLGQVLESVLRYRGRPGVLAAAAAMSLGVHFLFATGVYFIARGLPGPTHSYAHHLVILPLSAVAGVLPLPLGPFEWSLEMLYRALPLANGSSVAAGRGLLIALGYRLATLGTAGVGACCLLFRQRRTSRASAAGMAVAPPARPAIQAGRGVRRPIRSTA